MNSSKSYQEQAEEIVAKHNARVKNNSKSYQEQAEEIVAKHKAEIGKSGECILIDLHQDSMMQWFAYKHLPPHLQEASKVFHDLAYHVVTTTKPGRERSVCLRKLVEAKDAGVRAALNPGA